MNAVELLNKVCDDGIESVKKTEKGARRRGGILGFEMARRAISMAELEQLIQASREREHRVRERYDNKKATLPNYWEQRYITLQLEYTYEVLKVAYHDEHGRYPVLSARAINKYAEIVGVKEGSGNMDTES